MLIFKYIQRKPKYFLQANQFALIFHPKMLHYSICVKEKIFFFRINIFSKTRFTKKKNPLKYFLTKILISWLFT